MSTMEIMNLRKQEREALAMATQALYHVVHVRGLQVVAAEKLAEDYRGDTVKAENAQDDLTMQLEKLTESHDINTVGCQGHATRILDRVDSELARLKHELQEMKRYSKLVQLCMNAARLSVGILDAGAARAICEEVDRLKAEEMPF